MKRQSDWNGVRRVGHPASMQVASRISFGFRKPGCGEPFARYDREPQCCNFNLVIGGSLTLRPEVARDVSTTLDMTKKAGCPSRVRPRSRDYRREMRVARTKVARSSMEIIGFCEKDALSVGYRRNLVCPLAFAPADYLSARRPDCVGSDASQFARRRAGVQFR